MSITAEQSKNKSSRPKADLFEILVALGLCDYYGLDNTLLVKEKNNLISRLKVLQDGQARLDEQEGRALLTTPKIINELASLLVRGDQPTKVVWVGRGWQKKGSLSDIDVLFKLGKTVGISLKSTRIGKGTQKNIGAKKLRLYLGLDVADKIEDMWIRIREELTQRGGELKKLSTANSTYIKANKYKFPIIQDIGEAAGRSVQKFAAEKSVELFNKLSMEDKKAFLDFIFGAKEKEPLLIVLAEGKTISIGWNSYFPYSSSKNIRAILGKDEQGKGYHIMVNDKPVIRIQVSFTNGIGLSAFCERAFLN